MQKAHHFRFYNRAIRTKIGAELRTLFVPTEPTPKRVLELLSVLDQPKGGDAGWGEGESTENPKKFPKAKGAQGRFASKLSETSNPKDKTGGSETLPPQASDTSEEERVEKIPGGYIVRDANGVARH